MAFTPGTDEDVGHAFVGWLMAMRPELCADDGLSHVVQLGVLAEQFGVWALLNQVTSLLSHHLGQGTWELTPDAVDAIYQRVPMGRPLHRCVAEHVHQIGKQLHGSADDGEWKQAITKHGHIGWDLLQTPSPLPSPARPRKGQCGWFDARARTNPCRFHDHLEDRQDVTVEKSERSGLALGSPPVTCPYAFHDCYAVWGEDENVRPEPADASDERLTADDVGSGPSVRVDPSERPVSTTPYVSRARRRVAPLRVDPDESMLVCSTHGEVARAASPPVEVESEDGELVDDIVSD